ncbi:MAG: HEAT repeat domain-containing protein [Deltaproteobacteria bacterium]|nr:HEAT repeat domain-containing protein [Deltaproteobacteria bacterium]
MDYRIRVMAVSGVVFILSLSFATGCRQSKSGGAGERDTYKSPYLAADTVIRKPKAPEKPAVDPVETPPGEPVSRFHPASGEREYPLYGLEDIATSDKEKALLTMLSDPKKGVEALGKIRKSGVRARRLVVKALRSTNRQIRKQSCLILANLKDKSPKTVSALADAVLLDPEPTVRALAAKSFIAIRKSSATPALIRSLLEDPDAPTRANAARALGHTGGKGAVEALRKALDDPDTWVRLRSVSALKKRRSKASVPDLVRMLDDPNRMVRARAREVLKSLTGSDKGEKASDWR